MLDITFLKINAFLQDVKDLFSHPELDIKKLKAIPNDIDFQALEESDFITLYSKQVPGLIIGIPKNTSPVEIINDALLTHYDIPRYWIKKIKQSATLSDSKTGKVIENYIAVGKNILHYKS